MLISAGTALHFFNNEHQNSHIDQSENLENFIELTESQAKKVNDSEKCRDLFLSNPPYQIHRHPALSILPNLGAFIEKIGNL
ncbi:MAG: hypothetical protein HQM12_23475 [SAR324 cluster bacterium]|nr:hypothetical protein [SAR324 cluster bacterium]